ncbi:MAG: hypothetical protein GY778_20240 [bacterium]|nr:hypothetical protein [bacterium]
MVDEGVPAFVENSGGRSSSSKAPVSEPNGKERGALRPERLGDPPGEVPPRWARATSPSRVWSRGAFDSVQVNVDACGRNILSDAANEPSIAVDPTNPNRMAIGWRQFDTIESNFRQAGWGYSDDGGQTWHFPGVLDPGVVRSDPVLAADADGVFYYYSLTTEYVDLGCILHRSLDGGVSWDAGVYAFGGDKAWMAIDTTDGVGRGNLYFKWTDIYGCCYPDDFTRSVNEGVTYMPPIGIPEDPDYGTIAVGPAGEVYVFGANWDSGMYFRIAKSTNVLAPGSTPSFDARVVDLGGTLGYADGPNPSGLLGQAWVACDLSDGSTRGNVYALASIRPDVGSDPLDVMFARSTDGGLTWSEPVRINDDPPGTDVWQWFGTMSVAPNGRIDVIWNDTRNDATETYSELYYSYSADGGLSWAANVPVSPPFGHFLGYPNSNKLGDYYDMVSHNDAAHLAYAATFNGEQDVYYLRLIPDCNGNGTPDGTDIAQGTSNDCNANALPDECELDEDCNTNGFLDGCDIASGLSGDCNGNAVPDECEVDCNSNGIPDECDITAATSLDCQFNNVPDECELDGNDCNSNGVPDDCDIASGTSQDCQSDGLPDDCQLALNDCNSDGVPDECQDCNTNGLADECDIAAGTSDDCNANGVPDACEIAAESVALEFDGQDDQVRIARSIAIEPTDELTVEAWVRPDSVGAFHARVLRIAGHFGPGYILAWQQSGDRRVQFRIDQAEFGGVIAEDTQSTESYVGQWLHVAGVYSATGDYCRLYVNGSLRADEPGVGQMQYAGADLYIGNFINQNEDFDGLIDEVRVWNVARSQAEIAADMNRNLFGFETGLVGYWRFNDGVGQTAVDASPYGNHATLGTDADGTGDAADPVWVAPGVQTNARDCNTNGVLDDCDIVAGTSVDCNSDGIPDECDIRSSIDTTITHRVRVYIDDHDHLLLRANTLQWHHFSGGAAPGRHQDGSGNEPTWIDTAAWYPNWPEAAPAPINYEAWSSVYQGLTPPMPNREGALSIVALSARNPVAVAQLPAAQNNYTSVIEFDDYSAGPEWYEIDVVATYVLEWDCNTNGQPDICDIGSGISLDCNVNSVPDECEGYADCNNNAVNDICELAENDCNANGVPDECDAIGNDCDTNGVPDDCDPDCNGNGQADDCDIASGSIADCNTNGVPDDCEPDCNTNGVADQCDLASGSSSDCNVDGVPDECQPDCNSNGAADDCDISQTVSIDCNTDGIPDECGIDCNDNGIADECDLSSGTSTDCNSNSVLDQCDIASGASDDCNSNGTPDDCELDCNTNGVPDECDIAAGTSNDCNGNNIPDECDRDCNGNNVPDACDVAGGSSDDCNSNGIPDECEPDCDSNGLVDACEIASGTAVDCNDNFVPDACDVALGVSTDCDADGLPDECGILGGTVADCNLNCRPDVCDLDVGSSDDCNGNGAPDECELSGSDCNSNGVHDACEDCDGNGLADACDIAADPGSDANTNGILDGCERVLHVYAGALGPFDGLSWGTAFADPQDAMAFAAASGGVVEEIWLAAGVYTPAAPNGDRAIGFAAPDGVTIYGGFAGWESSREQRQPAMHLTVLSGDLNGDDQPGFINNGENSYHVVTATGPGLTAVLDGLVITDGNANGPPSDTHGGAVLVTEADVTITTCRIYANRADDWGGAVYNNGGTVLAESCAFFGNEVGDNGGAVMSLLGTTTLVNCLFSGNSAAYGGAMFGGAGTSVLTGCTIAGNSAGTGGGFYIAGETPSISGCVLWGNSDGTGNGESAQISGGPPTIDYSCVQGWTGGLGGVGNTGADPMLVDADGADDIAGTLDDDLRLLPGSTAIDAGDPTVTQQPGVTDLAGHPRVLCGRVDMGAYEFGMGDYNCDETIDLVDFTDWDTCLTGPNNGPYAPGCQAFDFEFDSDVDLNDFGGLQGALSGA